MEKKGFTLIELLAVIVILTVLITIAVPNVTKLLRDSKEDSTKIILNNLNDAAISYAQEQISLGNLKITSCPPNVDITNGNFNDTNNRGCAHKYSVDTLLNAGIFEDKKNACNKDSQIIVYKYNNGNYDEIKTFIPSDTCNVK